MIFSRLSYPLLYLEVISFLRPGYLIQSRPPPRLLELAASDSFAGVYRTFCLHVYVCRYRSTSFRTFHLSFPCSDPSYHLPCILGGRRGGSTPPPPDRRPWPVGTFVIAHRRRSTREEARPPIRTTRRVGRPIVFPFFGWFSCCAGLSLHQHTGKTSVD